MKYCILHGHFYQPPRENPWTGFIDRQESAYPYQNWNQRITTECYAASTRTSVFENHEIVKIINCFEYLSFNIGPTLMSWMEKLDANPQTIEKIIQGDKLSRVKNGGHGNAIAQVYNHLIMPLATERDQYTQILWGLQDFKSHFERDSEGIWLGETAINNETAAILVDCGVKFVILSPFQAKNIIVDSQITDVLGGRIDPTQPYKLYTKNGELAIFFYDPQLASNISFGDALTSADNLYNIINQSFNYQQKDIKLVHTATDGEVYGHHKAFGNMALAKLIYNIISSKTNEFQFTNYGYFLENNPPKIECELYLGELGEGSSWSCAHGVGRWIRDCGCHTGGEDGWNQQWREPLRKGFDFLRDQLYSVAENTTKDLVKDIWAARNDYILPMTQRKPELYTEFFQKHQKKELSTDEQKYILTIMEALRYSMLMYTSCGWFFSDLSGIETIQDLLYSYRAYEFSEKILDTQTLEQFHNILSDSHSNIHNHIDGTELLNKSILKYKITKNHFFEYICWVVLSIGEDTSLLETDDYIITIENLNLENHQFIIRFIDRVGEQYLIACSLYSNSQKYDYELMWKMIDSDTIEYSNLWNSTSEDWLFSKINNLPLFLRIRFIEQYVKKEKNTLNYCQDIDYSILLLNAVWGTEQLLLSHEKELLSFNFLSRAHLFAQSIREIENSTISIEVSTFIKEIEVLKKIINPTQDVSFYLEPIINIMEEYLYKTLYLFQSKLLRELRMLFWTIKDFIDPVRLDILRNVIYEFHIKKNYPSADITFVIELNTLMRDMGFLIK